LCPAGTHHITIHKRFYGRRAEWFEHFEDAYFVWWTKRSSAATLSHTVKLMAMRRSA